MPGKDESDDDYTRILLIVEDNAGDAEIIVDYLSEQCSDRYLVHHVATLNDANLVLKNKEIDIALLDLRLPDSDGVEGIDKLLSTKNDLPIVVLTGISRSEIEKKCLKHGAHDYLDKNELHPDMLRRSLRYAIAMTRELSRRRQAEERYEQLRIAADSKIEERLDELCGQIVLEFEALDSAPNIGDVKKIIRAVRSANWSEQMNPLA